jgi:hypothetical protein
MSFAAAPYLDRLKPFQLATVEHIFDRLFANADPVDRYLVADEVGLGKTMVARGLIAKMIEHYAEIDPTRRIDVLYVCSNQAIAKQNFSKLAVVGNSQSAVTDRITKLPIHVRDLEQTLPELGMAVNFIPITPTTSLDLRSNRGRVDERALLWTMLADERLLGRRYMSRKGPQRLLQQSVSDDRWAWEKACIDSGSIDPTLMDRFVRDATSGDPSLVDELRAAAELFKTIQRWADPRLGGRRTEIVGKLRRRLAETCIAALEPDLIILDEFQRFPRLLDLEESVGQLADVLFRQEEAKTLLLSATPYRMFTRRTEIDEDHHGDFLKTTAFLLGHDEAAVSSVSRALGGYRTALRSLQSDVPDMERVRAARDEAATLLGRVMCRTERLAATADRNGMLAFDPSDRIRPSLETSDLEQFRELDRVAETLRSHDVVEYWKSAPFPLNFMDGYQLAQDFEQALATGAVAPITHGLDAEGVHHLRKIDLGNARLRGLVDRLDKERAWSLLWLPPSLPYYTAGRPFDQAGITTKRLIFSAWTVVPKAIAALTSYEAERHLFAGEGKRPEGNALQWRPGGPMTEAALSMPSITLAELGDPLALARDAGGADGPVERRAVLTQVARRVRSALKSLRAPDVRSGPQDAKWYVVAPLLLDEQRAPESVAALLNSAEKVGSDATSWQQHRATIRRLVDDPSELGRRPADLEDVLAKLALAGPGTSALRALRRARIDEPVSKLLGPALELGLAFRNLFNLPEAHALVRALADSRFGDDVYWKAALDYCVSGNLQAVLDEYVHALTDWVEDRAPEKGGKVGAVVETAVQALGIKTTDLTARTIEQGGLGEPLHMRTRFALRLGDGRTEDAQAVNRVEHVRKAFNSPFWPFVLATTSIGQEGLDFHHYSHAVVHWNLPSNPVDLEQREGRVHRFKNHAVRKNLAARYRAEAIGSTDPWSALFAAAPAADDGLQPFWVFEGPARIERHALTLPMSRDEQRLEELARLLGIYRLAFGQPRQDELLAALQRVPNVEDRLHELLIDLRPLVAARI